ncbi:hypothetical protein KUTeg_002498 [Tegillarca granosa]|uniref:SUI1 domain-containing protein n=1 Tax=Tegillarca granosa TaxID=220873 RepID=A0ABQ9FVY7_TEGGR|nr:hypothetical protein KUTeg_002498 [Tegillarca granosa]
MQIGLFNNASMTTQTSISDSIVYSGRNDPFQDALTDDTGTTGVQDRLVHIRIQQRNGRKTLTTVQGLSQDYDLKRIAKVCKKVHGF